MFAEVYMHMWFMMLTDVSEQHIYHHTAESA